MLLDRTSHQHEHVARGYGGRAVLVVDSELNGVLEYCAFS